MQRVLDFCIGLDSGISDSKILKVSRSWHFDSHPQVVFRMEHAVRCWIHVTLNAASNGLHTLSLLQWATQSHVNDHKKPATDMMPDNVVQCASQLQSKRWLNNVMQCASHCGARATVCAYFLESAVYMLSWVSSVYTPWVSSVYTFLSQQCVFLSGMGMQ